MGMINSLHLHGKLFFASVTIDSDWSVGKYVLVSAWSKGIGPLFRWSAIPQICGIRSHICPPDVRSTRR